MFIPDIGQAKCIGKWQNVIEVIWIFLNQFLQSVFFSNDDEVAQTDDLSEDFIAVISSLLHVHGFHQYQNVEPDQVCRSGKDLHQRTVISEYIHG